MNFSIDQAALMRALATVAPAIGSANNPHAATRHVRVAVVAGEEKITITASSNTLAIQTVATAKIRASGICLVPACELLDLVELLTGTIMISLNAHGAVTLRTTGMTQLLKTISAEDFPDVHPSVGVAARLTGDDFAKLIEVTGHAVAEKNAASMPVLSGMHVRLKGGHLVATATDRLRMAGAAVKAVGDAEQMAPATLPQAALRAMRDVARWTGIGDMELISDSRSITLRAAETWVRTAIIEGTFPDIAGIVPKTPLGKLRVSREQLLQAVRMAAAFKATEVVLAVEQGGKTELSVVAAELGQGLARLDGAVLEGEAFSVMFNAGFLAAALQALKMDQVQIGWSGARAPLLVSSPDDPSVFTVLLPVTGKAVADADSEVSETPPVASEVAPGTRQVPTRVSKTKIGTAIAKPVPDVDAQNNFEVGCNDWIEGHAQRLAKMLVAGGQPVFDAKWTVVQRKEIEARMLINYQLMRLPKATPIAKHEAVFA